VRLADCIAADRVVTSLQSASLAEATDALVARLVASGSAADALKLRQRVAEFRSEDTVALGDRAWLVHVRTDAVHDVSIAIGTSREPICRETNDATEKCARMVVLIVAPPRLAARYLQLLSALSRTLSNPETVAAMLSAESPEQLVALPELVEVELPEQLSVRDVMTDRVDAVRPDHPLLDAARTMARSGLSALPVVTDDDRVVGLLSERELMRQLLTPYLQGSARGQNAPQKFVRDAMTRQVLCVSPDQPLADVASLMINKDVDRIPVVAEGRLTGVLTRSDIVRKLLGS